MTITNNIKPMSLVTSVLIFGGAALLFYVIQHYALQPLADLGINYALLLLIGELPLFLFFFGALYAYRKEGNPWTWQAFFDRFRIYKIKGKFWVWVILIVAVDVGLYLLVYSVGYPVVKWVHDAFPEPAIMKEIFGDATTFAGYKLAGNWWLLGLYFVIFFFNILGEEFLWRGYIFPRQEMTHGKNTWVVHGLLWTVFHIFSPYNALMVLPGALFMSWVVQKYKNTTIFILSHATLNGLAMIRIISGILG
ncbi:MAG: CPBP family intramembrane metalloprotease [Cyclobacteriaceae bacterium]|nr:CPBP family intramembrane metalloprotease [Cyclobacteriaceae bacterium]